MRAVVIERLGGAEVLQLKELERPQPGPGEVLVQVVCAGVNPADWKCREGYLGALEISDRSDEVFRRFVAERGLRLSSCGAMAAGDASFHSGWVLHSAPGNRTAITREAMTIIYYADGTHLLEPDHDKRRIDLERWHPGQRPGELAASVLNPVVYRR